MMSAVKAAKINANTVFTYSKIRNINIDSGMPATTASIGNNLSLYFSG